jgi:dihydrofolate reductase
MRKLIALVFHYSLNGLLADKGTEYYEFCFDLLDQAGGPDQDEQSLEFLQSAYAHIMGRTAYEGMAASLPANPHHPWAEILNAGRKVVFSRTLKTADWANTTIAAGDTAEEIDKLRQGGYSHIVVWGGVSLWQSLMRLDLIDEFHLGLHPYATRTPTGTCSTRRSRSGSSSTSTWTSRRSPPECACSGSTARASASSQAAPA